MNNSTITALDLAKERINILQINSIPYSYTARMIDGNLEYWDVENQYVVHYEFQYDPIDSPRTWYKGAIVLSSINDFSDELYTLVKRMKVELEK